MSVSGDTQGDPKRRPTRNDVAALAGVSSAVVSYVMNDGPRNVAPATRQRVLDAVKELGYRPNDAARSLRSQRNAMVGLVVDSSSSAGLHAMTAGVTETLARESVLLSVAHVGGDIEHDVQSLRLLSARVDGVLFVPSLERTSVPEAIRSEKLPVVAAGLPLTGAPSVVVDVRASGFLAVEHLVELGHTRIAVLLSRSRTASREFGDGCAQAVEAAGLHMDSELIVQVDDGVDSGLASTAGLLDLADAPTAFIAQNDLTAIGVLDALQQRGISVPQQVSVVGIDDLELGQHLTPALTTVPCRSEELGRVAAQLLLDLIGGKAVAPRTAVEPLVVVRASSGPR